MRAVFQIPPSNEYVRGNPRMCKEYPLCKNAYYENGVMETLPNIDINIKCGNSLIHRIPFQIGKTIGKRDSGFSKSDQLIIKNYICLIKYF